VSGLTIRSADGSRRVTRSAPSSRFLPYVAVDGAIAEVIDHADCDRSICFVSEARAWELVRYLNALDPVGTQLDVLLGERRFHRLLRRLELHHPGACHRCGGAMPAGSPAFWHPLTRLVRHVGRCPKPTQGSPSVRRSAA
jgi:hypothetical protein